MTIKYTSMPLSCVLLVFYGIVFMIREADGERILRIWKILLVVFKSSNNFNYVKEALNFLLQYYYVFSERQRAQLYFGVDIGANIPSDLFMEHLNRHLKKIIRIMGPNVTPTALQKGAKAIAPVQHV